MPGTPFPGEREADGGREKNRGRQGKRGRWGERRKRARQGGKEEGVGGERRLKGGTGVTGTDSRKEMEMERER